MHLGAAQAVLIVSAAATIGVVVPPSLVLLPALYMLVLWTMVAQWSIRNLKENKPVAQLKPA